MIDNKRDYFIVNLIFVIAIGVVFGYSYFFYPNNQPLQCVHKLYTGKNCSTCGFSRAFSSFTHFKYTEGNNYNKNAFKCFLFFVFQFLLRVYVLFLYKTDPKKLSKKFMILEVSATILFFLIAFAPLLM